MKEQILKLRNEGKTYNEISKLVGCSKSTISYHCGEGQKEKTKERTKKYRIKNVNYIINKKINSFLRNKLKNFKRGCNQIKTNSDIDYKVAFNRLTENPICYLTGAKINLYESSTYQLDHIIPISKGGNNNIENMGLTIAKANQAKSDMLVEDFIELCKSVLIHNNYSVIKDN